VAGLLRGRIGYPSHGEEVGGAVIVNAARKVISAQELSDVTGLPRSTIYRLTRQRDIPCFRAGRQYRYSVDEVLAAIRQPARDSDPSGRRGSW